VDNVIIHQTWVAPPGCSEFGRRPSRAGYSRGFSSTYGPDVDIARLERRRLRAIVEADRDTLEELHHADFVLCTPGGAIWDRPAYLNGLCDGTIAYTRFEPQSDIDVRASGSLAVLRYLSLIDVTTPTGGGHLECWHLDVYVRDSGGRWQCTWSHATDTIAD